MHYVKYILFYIKLTIVESIFNIFAPSAVEIAVPLKEDPSSGSTVSVADFLFVANCAPISDTISSDTLWTSISV